MSMHMRPVAGFAHGKAGLKGKAWADLAEEDSDSDLAELWPGLKKAESLGAASDSDEETRTTTGAASSDGSGLQTQDSLPDIEDQSDNADQDSSHGYDIPQATTQAERLLSHSSMSCKPCIFVRTGRTCPSGDNCTFCHLPHNRKEHPRPNRKKRSKFRRMLTQLGPGESDDVAAGQEEETSELPPAMMMIMFVPLNQF